MRKILWVLVLAGLIALPMSVQAATFTFDQPQLLGMGLAWDNGGKGDLDSGFPIALGDGAYFVGDVFDGTPQFRSIGIGYPWPTSPPINDLSGYDSYSLKFTNLNNQIWKVNLYMNTGWIDAPFSEADQFSQNGWTALAPGNSAYLTLDFAGVNNLNHVTNIGFQVAFDDPTAVAGIYGGDKYHLAVNVPEPMTLLLLGFGLVGIAGMRKKFKG